MNNRNGTFLNNNQMEMDISEITTTETNSGTKTFIKSFSNSDSSIDPNHVAYELPKKQFYIVFISLILCMIIVSLDVTIFASALPVITKEIHANDSYIKIIVSYLQANTALQPTIGKLADIFGKKSLMIFSLIIYMVGSIIGTVSNNFSMMAGSRMIQGFSTGFIASLSIIICLDIVSVKKRDIYLRYLNAFYFIAYSFGPLIGGIFTDFLSWRWIFLINIPLCIISIIGIGLYVKIPNPPGKTLEKVKRIDFIGSYFFIIMMACFIHAMNWGGSKFEWSSTIILGLIGAIFFLFFCFLFAEYKIAKEPIILLHLFRIENLSQCVIISFMSGVISISFNNTYSMLNQDGRGLSVIMSSLRISPLFFSYVFANVLCGWLIQKFGHLKEMTIIGSFGLFISCGLLSLIDENTPFYIEFFIYVFFGICITVPQQLSLVIASISAPIKLSTISASMALFFRMIGGVIGSAVFGMFVKNFFIWNYETDYSGSKNELLNNISNLKNGPHLYVKSIQYTYRVTYLLPVFIIFSLSIFLKKLRYIRITKPTKNLNELKNFEIPAY